MGFRSNVQRAGATTTKYSGTANVSARKTPRGQASITRAGEVVIKQGSQTTYIPPATFSGGKAAYKRYEAIKSVQGESAASQMAKEVAKGNLALQTIKPSVESYKKSKEASQAYRGVQTISGNIGVAGGLAAGGSQSNIQTLQPTASPIVESYKSSREASRKYREQFYEPVISEEQKYITITPKQPTETMAQRLKRASPNVYEYAMAGTTEQDMIPYLGMSKGFAKKYEEALPELMKEKEIRVPRKYWGTSSAKYGSVNEIGQIISPAAGMMAAQQSFAPTEATFGKSLYEPTKPKGLTPFRMPEASFGGGGGLVAMALLNRNAIDERIALGFKKVGVAQPLSAEDLGGGLEQSKKNIAHAEKILAERKNPILRGMAHYTLFSERKVAPTMLWAENEARFQVREKAYTNALTYVVARGVGTGLGASSSHLRALADVGGTKGKIAEYVGISGKIGGLALGVGYVGGLGLEASGYNITHEKWYNPKTYNLEKVSTPAEERIGRMLGREVVKLPIIISGLQSGIKTGKQWYSDYQWRHAKVYPADYFGVTSGYPSAKPSTHLKAFLENPHHPIKAEIKVSDRYGNRIEQVMFGGKKELPYLIKSKAGVLPSNTYNALLSQKGEGASMRVLKVFGDTNQWRQFPQWKLQYYKPKPIAYHGTSEEIGRSIKVGDSYIQGLFGSAQAGANFWGTGSESGWSLRNFFKLRGSPRTFILEPEKGFKIGKPDIKVGKQLGWSVKKHGEYGWFNVPKLKSEVEAVGLPKNPMGESVLFGKVKWQGYDVGFLWKKVGGGIRTESPVKTTFWEKFFGRNFGSKSMKDVGITLPSQSQSSMLELTYPVKQVKTSGGSSNFVRRIMGIGEFTNPSEVYGKGSGKYGSSLGYGLTLSTLFGVSKSKPSSSSMSADKYFSSSSKSYSTYKVPLSSYKSYKSSSVGISSSIVPSKSYTSRGSSYTSGSSYVPPYEPPPSSPPSSSYSRSGGIETAPPFTPISFGGTGGLRQKKSWNRYYYFERQHKIMSADSVMRMMFGGGNMTKNKGRKKK